MAGGCNDGDARHVCSIDHPRCQSTQHGTGQDDLGKDTGRDAHGFQQRRGPCAAPRVIALGGRGVAELAGGSAGKPVVEEVRHGEERGRTLQRRRLVDHHGKQLVEGVDLHELDAGLREDLLAGHAFEGLLQHAVCPIVAVVVGVADQSALPIEQAEVDAPGIQADARKRPELAGQRDRALGFHPRDAVRPSAGYGGHRGWVAAPVRWRSDGPRSDSATHHHTGRGSPGRFRRPGLAPSSSGAWTRLSPDTSVSCLSIGRSTLSTGEASPPVAPLAVGSGRPGRRPPAGGRRSS